MAENFGLKIGLEGEKEFKSALAEINNSFKVLGSEMKLVESQFDKNDNSIQALGSIVASVAVGMAVAMAAVGATVVAVGKSLVNMTILSLTERDTSDTGSNNQWFSLNGTRDITLSQLSEDAKEYIKNNLV